MIQRTLWLAMLLCGGGAVSALIVGPGTAHAQSAEKQSEKFRLAEEMKRLAQRNAWPGVEAKYEALLALNIPLDLDHHELGAQSARYLGKTFEVYERLERAKEIEPKESILTEMKAIDSGYGRVDIIGSERWTVTLRRPSMPFEPDKRKSVEYAITVCAGAGGFHGMLPAGDYIIGPEDASETLPFTVAPGSDWQELQVTKAMVSSTVGTIVYHGPVALLGFAYTTTGEPATPDDAADIDKAQPHAINAAGFGIEGGYQIGFAQEFGVAGTVAYRGAWAAPDNLHSVTGWLAAVVTPANARIAIGPSYSYLGGSGTGVAEWFDGGQDTIRNPVEEINFSGKALAGGLKFSAGYGLLDFEPLQGVVELGGLWQSDGTRSYMSFGVRVGITPRVPRFQD